MNPYTHPHNIWRCWNTSHTSNIDVGCNQWWFTASTMTPLQHHLSFGLHLIPIFQTFLTTTWTSITLWQGGIHMPIPSILWNAQTHQHIHPIWMWDAVSGGLQPQPWHHHNVIWAPPNPNFPNFSHNLLKYNHVRVHPFAHPQHVKVLKHFIV